MIDFSYWPFFFLAILGAVVANATGAGGGVVFVPAFTLLNVGGEQIIATSFAIQCFGMTAGTLAWYKHARAESLSLSPKGSEVCKAVRQATWAHYGSSIALFSVPAVFGLLLGQYVFSIESAASVKTIFKVFSILFAIAIFLTTAYLVKTQQLAQAPLEFNTPFTLLAVLIAWLGGVITAWLSIGVGELVAVMLILMRFPVRFAIGVAVSVSAVCVWFGVQRYLWFEPNINVHVLAFAAPAAVIGGTIAKRVVAHLSPVQVKMFIAAWILVSAFAM